MLEWFSFDKFTLTVKLAAEISALPTLRWISVVVKVV